jgi:HEAT repeat protein
VDPIVRGMALAALAPLQDPKLLDLARQALVNPAEDPPVKLGAVEVVRAAGGLANAKLLLSLAATPDPALRRRLGEALGSFADDKAAAEVYAALRHADPAVRSVAARALGRLKHPQAWDKLAEPLKDRNAEVRAAALESVAERKEKGSEALLQKEAQRADEDDAAVAIGLLRGFPSEATRQVLLKLAAHYKAAIAIPALEVLGELRAPEAQPVLAKALSHKDWPVRVTAIRGLARLATRESVDALVDRMAKEEGRLAGECGDALRRLTGKAIGYSAAAWKEWWSANRERFSFEEKPEGAPGAPGTTTYHGVPVLSHRLVFCLDVSGSMSEAADKDTRMEQAKKELARVLGSLGKDVQVNLVFFDDRVEPWRQQLVPVKANLPQALQAVASARPRGRTNIYDALALAFQHKDVDTVYLLSDGEPTDGRVVATEDILREIRKINRLRQVVIHTISFGPSAFMKELADQNGGLYAEIR